MEVFQWVRGLAAGSSLGGKKLFKALIFKWFFLRMTLELIQ